MPPEPLDFHQWEFEACREFLSDYPKVQQEINKENIAGIQNVRLHCMEHQKFMVQEQMAMAQAQAAAQPKPTPAKASEKPEKPAPNQPNQPQPTLQ